MLCFPLVAIAAAGWLAFGGPPRGDAHEEVPVAETEASPAAEPEPEEPAPPPLAAAFDLAEERRLRRLDRSKGMWTEVWRLIDEGRPKDAKALLEKLRAEDGKFLADAARAKEILRVDAAVAAEQRQALLEAMLAASKLSDEARGTLGRQLASSAEILARSANEQDLEVLSRHLRRFLLPDGTAGDGLSPGDGVLKQFLADRRGRRGGDTNPPVADKDEAEQRRVDQLEKLRQRDAVGLLDAIHAGLAWLSLHQKDDGSFSDATVLERCTSLKHTPASCLGEAASTGDNWRVAATALSAIAFLDFRDQDVHGWFDPYLGRALEWLKANQKKDGSFPGSGQHYSTAMAVMALGQAAASTGREDLRQACKAGIDYFARTQGPLGGFRYRPNDPEGDLSVTGWVAQAVEAARTARLDIPVTLEGGLSTYMRYVWLGESRFSYMRGGGESWKLSPVGMLLGHLAWKDKDDVTVESWKKRLKEWDVRRKPDLYALYYGVRLSILLTGELADPWRAWAFQTSALQVGKGTAAGSFPATVTWPRNPSPGTAVTTALAVLTLEHALYLR